MMILMIIIIIITIQTISNHDNKYNTILTVLRGPLMNSLQRGLTTRARKRPPRALPGCWCQSDRKGVRLASHIPWSRDSAPSATAHDPPSCNDRSEAKGINSFRIYFLARRRAVMSPTVLHTDGSIFSRTLILQAVSDQGAS